MIKKNMLKHFTNITPKKESARPLLQCINFDSDKKRITTTDSHRLLTVYDDSVTQSFNLNPNTLELNDAEYFQIDRLIPEKQAVNVSRSAFTKTHIPVLRALKEDIIKHSFDQNTWTVSADNLTIMRIELNDNNNDPQEIYMNAKYFLHFLDFAVNAAQTDKIHVSYSSPIRPVCFSSNEFDYLITPVRTY